MKILTFMVDSKSKVGLLYNDRVYTLPYASMIDLIEMDEMNNVSNMYKEIMENTHQYKAYMLEEVNVISPIPFPKRHILCVGKNYKEHAKELEGKTTSFKGIPQEPIFFAKGTYHTIGHNKALVVSKDDTQCLDYEVELAIIIGKKIKNVSAEEAYESIFGYTIGNDFSARDLQVKHQQWFKGKSLDDFTALGPWIVTKEEMVNPENMSIKCFVNNKVRQEGHTKDLIFNIGCIISDLSKGMTLVPGDIILTGTPSGVGMGFEPPKYLRHGDKVSCEIEGIGKLENVITII